MSLDLPKSYDAKLVEPDVYQRWERSGCFKAGAGKRGGKPYTIAIPPPNVTGVLHMGHALNNTLQDTLIRWRRMQGYDTLWQPGTDHAGIATESVVAKQIQDNQAFVDELKTAGISAENPPDTTATKTTTGYDRDRFGRTAFLKAVWHWKTKSGGAITHQLRKLGSSCDWSRERFTMDDGLTKAVRTMFVKLSDAGLIYRGTRMVNWCPVQKTALSDDEVEAIEKNGHLWQLTYDLVDGSGHIVVETTRPETFFGDTAVAVNPADPRYQAMIGKKVRLPIIGREIPIIGDEHADPTKGSGAVKITPAHDPNDYEVGKRHHLPLIRVIDFDGTMTKECAHFAGQDRFVCRKALLKELEASGVLLGATEIVHAVGHSYRSGVPIEPMVTEQWFVKMAPLAERAVKETREGRLHFHPDRWGKVYEHWLDNVRDWCISRQIWWGHRIPAWHCAVCSKATVAIETPTACKHCGSTQITQDPDVLDTWFSSALWPYSTLGWPEWEAAAKHYFPTSTLVTDRGIIFFWVARMVMTSLFANDVRPFDDVFIHGTVLDERGDKMSKSKGNGINPIVMIEGGSQMYLKKQYDCPGYGADAVRYTLLDMTTEGQDLKLSPSKFETGRNFANKVWNAGRFLLMNLSASPLSGLPSLDDLYAAFRKNPTTSFFPEKWLIGRLEATIAACTESLEKFRYNDYANAAYSFFRDDLCDWYLEWAKDCLKAVKDPQPGEDLAPATEYAHLVTKVLAYAFENSLRLLHPGMPFITEYLWQSLKTVTGGMAWAPDQFLMKQPWPSNTPGWNDPAIASSMKRLQGIVTAVRNLRNTQKLPDSAILSAGIQGDSAFGGDLADGIRQTFVMRRANLIGLRFGPHQIKNHLTEVLGDLVLVVKPNEDAAIDWASQIFLKEKVLASKKKSADGKRGRLNNPEYATKAPPSQVQETRDLLALEEKEIKHLESILNEMKQS